MESITTTPSHPHSPHSPLPQSADGCPLGLRWFPHSRSPRPAPSPEVSHFLIGKLRRIHFHAVLFAVNFSLAMSLRICCCEYCRCTQSAMSFSKGRLLPMDCRYGGEQRNSTCSAAMNCPQNAKKRSLLLEKTDERLRKGKNI